LNSMKPAFLITIDTEGDNLWAAPARITTENSQFIPRFQALCEKFGLKPTYLTDYHMMQCPVFSKLGREWMRQNSAEIGAHMHPWNTPPLKPITGNDDAYGPYATEYPPDLVAEKLAYLTRQLESVFEKKMISHRAGRWGFDGNYAKALLAERYIVDCSVTPGVSWKSSKGNPDGNGGPDFSNAPTEPYYLDVDDVCRRGDSSLLELPVTIISPAPAMVEEVRSKLADRNPFRRVLNRLYPPKTWIRPNGRNGRHILTVLRRAVAEGRTYAEFMLHSSELMPGGSPTFRTAASIEKLYGDLEALFAEASRLCRPATLGEFAKEYVASHPPVTKAPATEATTQ
jgi:hypothetical protein